MPKRLPPQFASPVASPGVLLWQAMNRWQRGQRRALRDAGLSHLQVMLLASVTSLAEQDEPVTQVMLARHARDGQLRPLPHVVVVDLRDGRADSVLELRLRGAEVVPLLLERVRAREVQLTGQDADIA